MTTRTMVDSTIFYMGPRYDSFFEAPGMYGLLGLDDWNNMERISLCITYDSCRTFHEQLAMRRGSKFIE